MAKVIKEKIKKPMKIIGIKVKELRLKKIKGKRK